METKANLMKPESYIKVHEDICCVTFSVLLVNYKKIKYFAAYMW